MSKTSNENRHPDNEGPAPPPPRDRRALRVEGGNGNDRGNMVEAVSCIFLALRKSYVSITSSHPAAQ